MTGRMLEAVEGVMLEERPDWVLVYGDTNSTLAGALAAAKLHIPVAHVEAGLRSFNMRMPEEVNRILADRVSSLLFCPTETAVANLQARGDRGRRRECRRRHVRRRALFRRASAPELRCAPPPRPDRAVVRACHLPSRRKHRRSAAACRASRARWRRWQRPCPSCCPSIRGRARCWARPGNFRRSAGCAWSNRCLSWTWSRSSRPQASIVTDSGGVQKEAFFYGVPCITMRDETEWVETVELGWNALAGADERGIVEAFERARSRPRTPATTGPYGDGKSARRIAQRLAQAG